MRLGGFTHVCGLAGAGWSQLGFEPCSDDHSNACMIIVHNFNKCIIYPVVMHVPCIGPLQESLHKIPTELRGKSKL